MYETRSQCAVEATIRNPTPPAILQLLFTDISDLNDQHEKGLSLITEKLQRILPKLTDPSVTPEPKTGSDFVSMVQAQISRMRYNRDRIGFIVNHVEDLIG